MQLPVVLVPHPHVRVDPKVLGGSPHVAGSRVPVRRLFAFFQSGATVEQLLRRFPHLAAAKVFDALAFALDNPEVMEADLAREAEMLQRIGQRAPAKPRGAEQIELPFSGSTSSRPAKRRRRS